MPVLATRTKPPSGRSVPVTFSPRESEMLLRVLEKVAPGTDEIEEHFPRLDERESFLGAVDRLALAHRACMAAQAAGGSRK